MGARLGRSELSGKGGPKQGTPAQGEPWAEAVTAGAAGSREWGEQVRTTSPVGASHLPVPSPVCLRALEGLA